MPTASQQYIEAPIIKGSTVPVKVEVPSALRVLDDGEKPAPGSSLLRVITTKDGDKRVVWDSRDFAQINDAKRMFDELAASGLVPYRVGTDGKATSEVMDEFDPAAEEVIFLPVGLVTGG